MGSIILNTANMYQRKKVSKILYNIALGEFNRVAKNKDSNVRIIVAGDYATLSNKLDDMEQSDIVINKSILKGDSLGIHLYSLASSIHHFLTRRSDGHIKIVVIGRLLTRE